MILWGSLPNHENRRYTMEPSLRHLRGTAGRVFLICLFLIHRGATACGGVAIIVREEHEKKSRMITE